MSNTRKHDLEQLRQEFDSADNQGKEAIKKAAYKIQRESGSIKSMRERLIKEHRAGRVGNIKDIHEYIKKKDKYQNK